MIMPIFCGDTGCVYVNTAGCCVELEAVSAVAGKEDSNSNRLKKQKLKQLKRMETVESASFLIVHQLLEEVSAIACLILSYAVLFCTLLCCAVL